MKNRLAAVSYRREFAPAGRLLSLGRRPGRHRRTSAGYVDRVLKGARTADLPVQQATKFELVVNQKTARALGPTLSPMLLSRADEVIRMKRRLLLAAAASLASTSAWAQTPERLRKVGVLIDGSAPHRLPDVLRTSLAGRGWVEGRTIAFDVRYADGQPARAAEQAAELVKSEVDIIVGHFTPAVRAAMAATKTIPIIMAPAGAPWRPAWWRAWPARRQRHRRHQHGGRAGRAAPAAPQGHDPEPRPRRRARLLARRLHEAFSCLPRGRGEERRPPARPVPVAGPADFPAAFARMAEARAGAVLVIQGVFNSHRAAIVEIAL